MLGQRHDALEPEQLTPLILPLGDQAMLIRFGDRLTDEANLAAIDFSRRADAAALQGVVEVVPNLVSVLLRYEPATISFERLAGEVRLLVSGEPQQQGQPREVLVQVAFDGEDLHEVVGLLHLSVDAFISAHNGLPLRVLATGFAPGFVYCGMHQDSLVVPRRRSVRRRVPAGTVLFAAGQTAITSTAIPTGWHVIGRTGFRNFDPSRLPPSDLVAGDVVRFEAT